jgi:hypothetical protein
MDWMCTTPSPTNAGPKEAGTPSGAPHTGRGAGLEQQAGRIVTDKLQDAA